MLRYFSPALFFATAIYAYWHNTNDGASIWMLPFMDVIWPETANSPAAQGEKTVIVLIALGIVLTVLQVFKDWRHRRQLREHFRETQT